MDEQYEDDVTGSPEATTSEIFSHLQNLYTDQIEKVDDSNEGLKVKVEIFQIWVKDLTAQNEMLIKTVDEMESEALKRLGMLEENLSPKASEQDSQKPQELVSTPPSLKDKVKDTDQIEALCQELEEVKLQLCEKDKLVSKYKQRLEELKSAVKEDKLNPCNKKYVHNYSMTENEVNVNTRPFEPQSSSALHRELECNQQQLCVMEKEVSLSKKKLKEAETNIKRLRCDLVTSEKNAKEMRAALSAEVAEKHDQVLALRKEVAQLEDQLRQADMQTHFKDDIIKELRKEVKVARSKETLVEVLGIKERSLSHLEQLTQQLEQKEMTISCLKAQLKQTPDTLYRVRQQINWFTENISQQCATNNIPEEFKKCITTMLEELRESVECCNIGPSNTSEQQKVR